MKKYSILLLCIFFVIAASAQNGFGFGVGMSTSKAPLVNVKYFFDKNAVSVGASYQVFNDALGTRHDEFIPGSTGIDDGDYFYSFDVGYTRVISDNFSIAGELSFATRKYFWNFSNENYSASGYHWVHKTKSEFGGGAMVFYNLSEVFGFFAGYNTIREGTFGVEFRFLKDKQY